MTSDRPYRAARSPNEALAELERCAGTQFDTTVVFALSQVLEQLLPPPDRQLTDLQRAPEIGTPVD